MNSNQARENPPLFFRRALKIVNGNNIQVPGWPACPGGVVCGLTIAAENPAYVQGDYNSNSAGGGFTILMWPLRLPPTPSHFFPINGTM